jgi:predicted DNA-binding ribbon-helix-helix protein
MIRKHSTTLHGHRTSFSLEDEFWSELNAIAVARVIPLAALISEIDDQRDPDSNLSSALRVYVLSTLKVAQGRLKPAAHTEASHNRNDESGNDRY